MAFNGTPEKKFLAYELSSVVNPDSWARQFKKRGARSTTLEGIEIRRQNRYAIREVLFEDKTGFNLEIPQGFLVVEILDPAFKGGSNNPSLRIKTVEGPMSFFEFRILRPTKKLSASSFVAETSEGSKHILVSAGMDVKVKEPSLMQ